MGDNLYQPQIEFQGAKSIDPSSLIYQRGARTCNHAENKHTKSIPQHLKIKTDSQFSTIFTKGKKIKSECCAIFFYPNNLPYPRIGIIVAKKNINKAVRRNSCRRVVRESFRYHQQDFVGVDIIINIYRSANNLTKKQLRTCIEEQWQKLIMLLKK